MTGDTTKFKEICEWENIRTTTIKFINLLEEIYYSWGFIKLKAGKEVD